jgi:NIMA (never in mitosis gene a)-related kinase 10
MESLKQQIKISNQTQSPTNYINDYAVYEIIGSGAFGRVHKVKKKNSSVFLAMKEINTYNLNSFKSNNSSLGEIVNEVTIIRNNLKHPNIVRYLKTFKENDSLYIVMELIDGTPLSQHVRTLKEKQEYWHEEKIWHLFIQIVLALKYLHKEKHIVHRDLTSNNIMLSENDRITITDFGLAKLKENDCSKMLSVVGTMFYSCPEIIKNEPYNDKADIWAIGCVLYEMCCLEPPFCTSNMLALATKITQSDYDHERLERNSYSSLISQVVQTCLIVEPGKRPDIIGVASLVAEKILNYTDSIRYKCVSLEKKLEKEKNKTQKLFCNKQDLNYQQRNQLNVKSATGAQTPASITSQAPTEDTINTSNSNMANSSLLNAQKETKPQRVERSISLSISGCTPKQKDENELHSKQEQAQEIPNSKANTKSTSSSPSLPNSILSSQSPNAKLPPIRHPKSKLIIKNMQNKQQKQQETQKPVASIKPSSSNTSLNQEVINQSVSTSDPCTKERTTSATGEAESKIQQQQQSANKIQRSSSSSILEKR